MEILYQLYILILYNNAEMELYNMKTKEKKKIEELSKKYKKSEKLIKLMLKIYEDNNKNNELKDIEEYLKML